MPWAIGCFKCTTCAFFAASGWKFACNFQLANTTTHNPNSGQRHICQKLQPDFLLQGKFVVLPPSLWRADSLDNQLFSYVLAESASWLGEELWKSLVFFVMGFYPLWSVIFPIVSLKLMLVLEYLKVLTTTQTFLAVKDPVSGGFMLSVWALTIVNMWPFLREITGSVIVMTVNPTQNRNKNFKYGIKVPC